MRFLQIVDCTRTWNSMAENDLEWKGVAPICDFYGIQLDVKDYHIFRIYRDGDMVFMDHELLPVESSKHNVLAVMKRDFENGMESSECESFPSVEEAMNKVTGHGYWELGS